MSSSLQKPRKRGKEVRPAGPACPRCGAGVGVNASHCPSCGFTGENILEMFPETPPPLLPVLDAADLWKPEDVKLIEIAREKLRRRFPQFRFHVCTIMLPPETGLSAFGFWLLNACPLYVDETPGDRAWTVLLLLNVSDGRASVASGYAAESWLHDDDWRKVLSCMGALWKAGRSARSVVRFFETTAFFLEHSWKRHGSRQHS